MPLGVDYDDGEDSECGELLALHQLWRSVECVAHAGRATRTKFMAVSASPIAGKLNELIAALDRRVPRRTHAREASIAHDAQVLRAKAVKRLAELATSSSRPAD
jgi:hypothetical protein